MVRKIKRRGLMLVISSPSGAGKTSLAKLLLKSDKHLHSSISCTTRRIRPGEVDGKDYYFLTNEQFNAMKDAGDFLEYVEAFGNQYGTPKNIVNEYLSSGEDVLFDIEWQGNRKLTEIAREDVVSVFIFPPSKQELLNRLRSRNQDDIDVIEYRMRKADQEISHWDEYDYAIINRDIDKSLKKLLSILRAERLKKARRIGIRAFVSALIKEKVMY